MRLLGALFLIFGFLISLSIIGAVFGIPMMLIGLVLLVVGGRKKTVITNVVQVSNNPGLHYADGNIDVRQPMNSRLNEHQYIEPPLSRPALRSGPSVSDRLGPAPTPLDTFQDIEDEITQKSINILRAAKADGYDVQYMKSGNRILVRRGGAEGLYLFSNGQIRDFGRTNGYQDSNMEN